MTPYQTQLHENISFKGTMYKLSPALMADTIKFNAMVLRNTKNK